PDGSRILFSSDRGGIYDLYAVDAAGDGRRLTAMTGGAFDPEWLPDGSGFVFAGFSEGMFRIYRYDLSPDTAAYPTIALADAVAAAGAGRRLPAMTGGAFGPGWLPAGSGFVFAGFSEGMFRIYRYDLAPDTAAYPTIALADAVAPGCVVGDGPADPDVLPMGW